MSERLDGPRLPPHEALVAGLKDRLAAPLPGLEAQLTMAPPHRGDPAALEPVARTGTPAAVLVLLYPVEGASTLVLTERTAGLRSHSGQVSLPGGRLDPGETAEAAALREAEEEVGVPRTAPELLGRLTDLYIPPSRYLVTPFVAALPERPRLVPAAREVAALVEVPLGALLDPALRAAEDWTLGGRMIRVPFFRLAGYEVWGATAMMLAELAVLLDGMQAP